MVGVSQELLIHVVVPQACLWGWGLLKDTPSGREPKHPLLVVLGEEGETFDVVGAFVVPPSPTEISTPQVCELWIT